MATAHLALPADKACASFSGILAGELAKSRTSCQYVLARRKMNTTFTSKKRKYLWKGLRGAPVNSG